MNYFFVSKFNILGKLMIAKLLLNPKFNKRDILGDISFIEK